jgi:hypothetical protein
MKVQPPNEIQTQCFSVYTVVNFRGHRVGFQNRFFYTSGEYEIEASQMRKGKLIQVTVIAWKFDPNTEQVDTFIVTMMTTEYHVTDVLLVRVNKQADKGRI